jgi:arylsulfatase A-like enzyme
VIDTPVSSVDFFPTMCAAAGLNAGDVDGVSLLPLLRGGSLRPRALFWHYPHYSNQGGEPGSAIREGDWKLIEFHVDGRRELYNLRRDASETKNLAAKEPAVAAALAARLGNWRKKWGAVMPQKNPQADPSWPGWHLTGEEKPTPPS